MSAQLIVQIAPDAGRKIASDPGGWEGMARRRWSRIAEESASLTISEGPERDLAAAFLVEVGLVLRWSLGPKRPGGGPVPADGPEAVEDPMEGVLVL